MGDQPPDWPYRQGTGQPRSYANGYGQASGTVESPPPVQAPPRTGRHGAASKPRRWRLPAFIAGVAVLVPVAVFTGVITTGGQSPSASLPSGATAPANAPVIGPSASSAASSSASAPWSGSCQSKLASWRGTGAGGQLQAVVTAVTIMLQAATSLEPGLSSGAAPADKVTAFRPAVTSLRSVIRAAQENLIPACVSGAHLAEGTGLTELGRAVADYQNALAAIGGGSSQAALRNIRAGITAMQSGSAEMAKATADVNRYGSR
jgi:hypothetical protein